MTDRNAVAEFFSAPRAAGDHFDFVIMSAAVHGACPIEAMKDEFVETVFRVNLIAHAQFLRDVLPQLNDGARIIGLSSNCAEIGIPMEAVYAATKAGMERIYEALAIEAAHRRIRPLVIQTGNVNTGFNETGNDYQPEGDGYVANAYRAVIDKIDSRNGISPVKVAEAAVRLLYAARPPFRTLVGSNAVKTYWAQRLLGTDLALRLVVGALGIRRADRDVVPSPSSKRAVKRSS
jgi:NAD(P)-dependent dehydrogenase (short-subunit alcohol dehydrogenase family)